MAIIDMKYCAEIRPAVLCFDC